MEYDVELSLLSSKFTQDYPPAACPELMHKQGRPYTCLLIDSHDAYFICIPFRSFIGHKNAFIFKSTTRSRKTRSGLDYSKIAIIKNIDYFDLTTPAIVDQDEYAELMRNLSSIVREATGYVDTYIKHVTETSPIHPKEFARKYRYSSLPYFHDIMGIAEF